MYDTVDALHDCVRIATGVLSTLSINPDRMMKVCPYNKSASVIWLETAR
jgi:argininosuccinate lyase